ncbi:MAG: MarR family winged helix-turn-helix transcriptional regulator [Trebonia sp.]
MADERAAAEIGVALRRLLQAGREMQAALARQMGLRITDVQAVDHVVSAGQPVGTVELGDRMGIRSASAAALVDRLAVAGHLARQPHPSDRRRVTLKATDHARDEVHQALAPLLDDLAAISSQLDDGQARTVLAFLADVTAAMRAYAAKPGPGKDPKDPGAPNL